MLDEGFAAACEFLGIRARVVAYVEREASAAAMLMARMDEESLEPAPVWCGDLADFPWEEFRGMVDGIVGGIPCQPFSVAGEQRGVSDERWLWPLVWDLRAKLEAWFIGIENVGGFIRAGLGPLLDDLAEGGWSAEWLHLRASAIGASHARERIFCLAHDPSRGFGELREPPRRYGQPECDVAELADATGERGARIRVSATERRIGPADIERRGRELGNSPRDDEQRNPESKCDGKGKPSRGACNLLAGDGQQGLEGSERCRAHGDEGPAARGSTGKCGSPSLFAPGPTDGRWPDIIAAYPYLAPATEQGLCVLVDGVAVALDDDRTDALRAAGNGVVAAQAAVAFVELLRRLRREGR